MQYLCWGLLCILGVLKKNRKWLLFLIYIFMFILFGLCTNCADNDNYKYLYTFLQSNSNWKVTGQEIGFVNLMRLSIFLGLNYQSFRCIVFFLGIFLISITIFRFTNNVTFVMALYFIAPFFSNVMQLRNFVAESILVFAVPFLLNKGMVSKIKYILLIMIATSIQYSAIFYLLLLLVKIKNKKYLNRLIIIGITVLILGCRLLPNLSSIFTFIPIYKFEQYLGNIEINYRFLLRTLYLAVETGLVKYTMVITNNMYEENCGNITKENVEFAFLIYWVNVAALICYPFLLYSGVFYRLFRNLLGLNYIAFANIVLKKYLGKKNFLFLLLILLCSIFMLVFDQFSVLDEIFSNNLLW